MHGVQINAQGLQYADLHLVFYYQHSPMHSSFAIDANELLGMVLVADGEMRAHVQVAG